MPTRRTVRVAEVLRKELSACLHQCRELEGFLITISSVELPPDLKQAYVFVSTIHPDLDLAAALNILNRNRKVWQSRIGQRLGLKFTPQLIFRFDRGVERGDRVMEILTQLNLNTPDKGGAPVNLPEEPEDPEELDPDDHRMLTEEDVVHEKTGGDEEEEEEKPAPAAKLKAKAKTSKDKTARKIRINDPFHEDL